MILILALTRSPNRPRRPVVTVNETGSWTSLYNRPEIDKLKKYDVPQKRKGVGWGHLTWRDVTWIIMVITNQSMLDIWRRWRNRVRSVIMRPGNQWSNYGGARGGLANLKDLAAPAKHLFWEGSRGPVKSPLKLQDDHPLFIDALLQFASVFILKLQ